VEPSSSPSLVHIPITNNIIIEMGTPPNTNWILKTVICYVIRGHRDRQPGVRALVYILKACRVLANVTEQTFSLAVITGRVPRRGRGWEDEWMQIFHTRYNYSVNPVRHYPSSPQYARPDRSTSIYTIKLIIRK